MIGIIGAMDEEVSELAKNMTDQKTYDHAGMKFISGKLKGKDTVLVVSGIGKVNAGACTQILIDTYHVDCVINTGIAGALHNEVNIGDIVLSSDAVQHDVDVKSFGYAPGQIPRMGTLAFPADKRLIDAAERACRRTHPELGVYTGRVASGDQFIADKGKKAEITRVFDAYCCEMEGAAIAQISWINKIPFIIIRAMSDKADGTAAEQYDVFQSEAIGHFVDITLSMMDEL
jgi:adenosylhomocysteine nucleosidase